MNLREIYRDKAFLGLVFSIAIPVALQSLLGYFTEFLDTAMIGRLGTAEISAVGLASQFFTVGMFLMYGLQSGTGILLSQFFGAGDVANVKKTLGIGLSTASIVSLIFAGIANLAPRQVMMFYTESEEAIAFGCDYLRIVGLSYPVYAAGIILKGCFCSVRKAKYPVIASILSIVVNLSLNYCLIFGNFGFPALGVKGAAIATAISRVAELLALCCFGRRCSEVFRGKPSDYFGWESSLLKNYAVHAIPVVMTELVFSLGTNFYYVAYGRLGDDAVASLTIAESIRRCAVVFGNGLFSATGVLVGNELGADHPVLAQKYADRMLVISVIAALIADLVLLLLMKPMMSLFSVPAPVLQTVIRILLIEMVITVLKYFYGIIIVGVLPAGGDTRASFLIDVSTVWLIGIPMAFLGVMVWQLPVWQVYALVGAEHLVKTGLSVGRYRQKKWVRNLTKV